MIVIWDYEKNKPATECLWEGLGKTMYFHTEAEALEWAKTTHRLNLKESLRFHLEDEESIKDMGSEFNKMKLKLHDYEKMRSKYYEQCVIIGDQKEQISILERRKEELLCNIESLHGLIKEIS